MAARDELKEQILAAVDSLPEPGLEELAAFLGYLRDKFGSYPVQATPYKPIALGGLWKGIRISDDDIAEARREMWGNFGERQL